MALLISSIEVHTIKTTSAIVRWNSLEPGTSTIEYGRTGYGYEYVTPEDPYAYVHRIELTNLLEGQSYTYRVRGKDINLTETIFTSAFFVTKTQSQVNAMITAARNPANGTTAKQYYVSTTGSDSNNGSQSTPFRTVAFAVSKTDVGDTVYVMSGTYSNEYVTFPKSGIDIAPITLTSLNGLGTVTLQGTSYTGLGINIYNKDHIRVSGLIVKNYNGAVINPGSFTIISNCDLGLCSGMVAHLCDGDQYYRATGRSQREVIYQNNKIHDTAMTNDTSPNMIWGEGGNVDNGQMPAYDIFFINNEVYGKSLHETLDIMSYSPGPPPPSYTNVGLYNVVIKGNIIHDIQTNGFYIHYGSINRLTMRDNEWYNVPTYGMYVFVDNCLFDNNYIHGGSANYFDIYAESSKNTTYKSNRADRLRISGPGTNLILNNNSTLTRIDASAIIRNSTLQVFRVEAQWASTATIQFTDNKIFTTLITWNNGYTLTGPTYYTDRSESLFTASASTIQITSYPMTVKPSSGTCTVAVNIFNLTLPIGSVLVDVNVTPTVSNNISFSVSSLKPNKYYNVNKGSTLVKVSSDANGTILFTDTSSANKKYTVIETTEVVTCPDLTCTLSVSGV